MGRRFGVWVLLFSLNLSCFDSYSANEDKQENLAWLDEQTACPIYTLQIFEKTPRSDCLFVGNVAKGWLGKGGDSSTTFSTPDTPSSSSSTSRELKSHLKTKDCTCRKAWTLSWKWWNVILITIMSFQTSKRYEIINLQVVSVCTWWSGRQICIFYGLKKVCKTRNTFPYIKNFLWTASWTKILTSTYQFLFEPAKPRSLKLLTLNGLAFWHFHFHPCWVGITQASLEQHCVRTGK